MYLVCLVVLVVCGGLSAAEKPAQTAARPAILLTGFEPFGAERAPNPSWEGIKPLDGRTWKKYRIVCRQLPVVWGEPQRHLSKWIDELHPVAIFSFGQGGGFTVETRASNFPGRYPDNLGHVPPEPKIIADGPGEFLATIDSQAISRALTAKGYPVRISTNAGRYLCEETLYTLEYLKTKQKLGAVAFCHVPPLGAVVGGRKVSADYISQFVMDVLAAWNGAAKHE